MDTLKRLIASAVVVVPLSSALAETPASGDASTAAVETLRASLGGKGAIDVENVRMTDDGVACIDYRGPNNSGGMSKAKAVVQGDKVLRSGVGNERFADAWNEHCAGTRAASKDKD
jgi:hypothetical protein